MKNYFKFIDILQESLLGVSIATLMVLPILISYYPQVLAPGYQTFLFGVSFAAVTFVMAIRPLADLLGGYTKWIRPPCDTAQRIRGTLCIYCRICHSFENNDTRTIPTFSSLSGAFVLVTQQVRTLCTPRRSNFHTSSYHLK